MSTNFYGIISPCKCCGIPKQSIHIGKRVGVEFVSSYTMAGIEKIISVSDRIDDEYGVTISKPYMRSIVMLMEKEIRTVPYFDFS